MTYCWTPLELRAAATYSVCIWLAAPEPTQVAADLVNARAACSGLEKYIDRLEAKIASA